MKKKLKNRKFRYVEKDEISKPLQSLHQFYKLDVSFKTWRMDVELLLLSGLDGRLKRNGFEYGLTAQRLIKQVEIAYVLYTAANIKKKVDFQRHVKSVREMYGVLNQERVYSTTEALFLFFECQSLNEWRVELDFMISYASLALENEDNPNNDNALLVYIRIMALIDALHQIYLDNGMHADLLNHALKRKSYDTLT